MSSWVGGNSIPMAGCTKLDSNLRSYALIICAGLLVFSPCLFNFFVSDDFIWINQGADFSLHDFFQEDEEAGNNIFRPLISPFFFVLYRIFGLSAVGYHLISIVFHILNGLLLFSVLLRLSLSRDLALVSSLVFLTHFAHEETVLWISSNCVLVCWFLSLASVSAFLKWLNHGTGRWYLMSLVLGASAPLTREDALFLPVILSLIVGWSVFLAKRKAISLTGRRRRWINVMSVVPFFLLGLVYLYLRSICLSGLRMQSLFSLAPVSVIRNLAYFLANLSLPLRPFFDAVGYHHSAEINSTIGKIAADPPLTVSLASLLVIAGLAAALAIWILEKTGAGFRLSVIVFLMALTPVLFFPGFGLRLTYLPLLGFCPMAGLALLWMAKRAAQVLPRLKGRHVSIAITLVIVLNFFILLERHIWWTKAGRICHQTITSAWIAVSSLPVGSAACFEELPDRLHGAYILNNGMVEAMNLFRPAYHNQIRIVNDKEPYETKLRKSHGFYRFRYERGGFRRLF